MTPRNQMYSVLTRETTWLRAYLLFYATLGLMTGWLLADACEIFGHKRAAKANALTYEDGLALANNREALLKKSHHPWALKMSEKDRRQWTTILARAYDDAERTRK